MSVDLTDIIFEGTPKHWDSPRVNKPPVVASPDLTRIVNLPRRPLPDEVTKEALIELMTERLGYSNPDCACKMIDPKRDCIERLLITQAWALYEIMRKEGLLGPINVGDGKTVLDILAPMVMPDCKTALLLIPANLVDQLILEYRMVREHFRVPALRVHGRDYVVRIPGPVLHVISYERLSRSDATVFLAGIDADTHIYDECDNLSNPEAVRTGRILRHFADNPDVRCCAWSGSLTDDSIHDYSHLAVLTLREGSPTPLDPRVVSDWARALDPSDNPAPMGALKALCAPGEDLYAGFSRRLIETEGVVTSTTPQVTAALEIAEREAPKMPAVIREALKHLREFWELPEGEEVIDALEFFRHARELSSGFYYRWIFRNGETVAEIDEWKAARKLWRSEMRRKLKSPRPYFDSPELLERAVIRAYENPNGAKNFWLAPVQGYDEPQPHWRAEHWPRWQKARPLVNRGRDPDTESVRLHSYLVEDAAQWASENKGVVWYDKEDFGLWLAEISGLPMYGGGDKAARAIVQERGDRSIIASTPSHGRGRNGLQFAFHKQLVAHPPSSSKVWQQMLGRLHRAGQRADTVYTEFYAHTPELRRQIDSALLKAGYVAGTIRQDQKLKKGLSISE